VKRLGRVPLYPSGAMRRVCVPLAQEHLDWLRAQAGTEGGRYEQPTVQTVIRRLIDEAMVAPEPRT